MAAHGVSSSALLFQQELSESSDEEFAFPELLLPSGPEPMDIDDDVDDDEEDAAAVQKAPLVAPAPVQKAPLVAPAPAPAPAPAQKAALVAPAHAPPLPPRRKKQSPARVESPGSSSDDIAAADWDLLGNY